MKAFVRLLSVALLAVLCSCTDQKRTPSLNIDVLLPSTPVKDQGQSTLCWDYAMLATIESDRLAIGDSVNISPDYIAYCWLRSQAQAYYLTHGHQPLSLRATPTTLLTLLQRYGAMPFDTFRPRQRPDYNLLLHQLQLMADAAIAHHERLDNFSRRVDQLLSQEIASPPRRVHMLGADYTPLEFAHSVCLPHDYLALTSFAHHPFGQKFVLETADNVFADEYLNVPIDSLTDIVKESIANGHAVCWQGDTSNEWFAADGMALYDPATPVTQRQRQTAFETFALTDDHSLALVGLAHDADSRLYFIAKNSWGEEAGHGGFWYLSEQYFRLHTIAVVVRQP